MLSENDRRLDLWIERSIAIHPIHPRQPEPSYAELRAIPDWLRTDKFVTARLTVDELLQLAEQAIQTANILRQIEREGR